MPKRSRTQNSASTALALSHLHLVAAIANAMHKTLPACGVDREDLTAAGMVGLVDAANKYDSTKNTAFGTYARHRIRGAIQDSLRALDPLSRDMRKQYREAERAVTDLTQKPGRPPMDIEIARRLKLPVKRWRRVAQQFYDVGFPVNGHQPFDKPALLVECLEGRWHDPEQAAVGNEMRQTLNDAVSILPPRYRKVIQLYYAREWTMKEIGRLLDVNESRVSQIHAWALLRLREALQLRFYLSQL